MDNDEAGLKGVERVCFQVNAHRNDNLYVFELKAILYFLSCDFCDLSTALRS